MAAAAVFFDGDQTLWDFRLLLRRALAATLQELRRLRPGPQTASLTVAQLIADRRQVDAADPDLDRMRLAAFIRTLERIGLPDPALAATLNEHYLRHRFTGVEPYPDVRPVLHFMRRTCRIGLLSNGNGCPAGFSGEFDAVVFSQEHGMSKPDSRLFEIAANAIGATAGEILMVGDSIRNDVEGAQNAGWKGIWINRDGQKLPASARPDAVISGLAELPDAYVKLRATM